MTKPVHLVAFAVLLSTAACSAGVGEEAIDDGGWQLIEETDKFTDQTNRSAQRTFVQDETQVELAISCNNGEVTYQATAFDADGNGLDFSTQSGLDYYGNPYAQSRVWLRFDDLETIPLTASIPEYSNQADILVRWEKQDAVQARNVLLRLQFVDRSTDLEIDQSDSAVQRVLEPCAEAMEPQAQNPQAADERGALEQQEEREQIKAQQEAEKAAFDAELAERERAEEAAEARKQAEQTAIDAKNEAELERRRAEFEQEAELRRQKQAAEQAERDARFMQQVEGAKQ